MSVTSRLINRKIQLLIKLKNKSKKITILEQTFCPLTGYGNAL